MMPFLPWRTYHLCFKCLDCVSLQRSRLLAQSRKVLAARKNCSIVVSRCSRSRLSLANQKTLNGYCRFSGKGMLRLLNRGRPDNLPEELLASIELHAPRLSTNDVFDRLPKPGPFGNRLLRSQVGLDPILLVESSRLGQIDLCVHQLRTTPQLQHMSAQRHFETQSHSPLGIHFETQTLYAVKLKSFNGAAR
ncbi:hypothetical protein EJ03DRAFT_62303 [Teratosphaeria nubilosa]|uniref:Uncharacterized protein n=1 Tax=Teratosphaeria nubilosa TaxID=161662 RepID=A0A6G1KU85_9PEZI|nr:hypothetical protein EJ03DRAFT_62303 [Teratosphaeria nubilosa]